MVSANVGSSRSHERTPLLGSNARRSSGTESLREAFRDAAAIDRVGEGALEVPVFPGLGKRRSYSHSHWLAPDEDPSSIPDPDTPPQFSENGLLEGLSKTKFWLIYGGILLGYFVSGRWDVLL